MQVVEQDLQTILDSLRDLKVDWQDDTAKRVIATLEAVPVKNTYALAEAQAFLDENFEDGLLICRLFLGLSKDAFMTVLRDELGDYPERFRANRL